MRSVCVFCGSKPGARPEYADVARRAAEVLVRRNIALVYGGAVNGIMGVVADTVLALGGTVIGVIPTLIADRELAHKKLTELHVVSSMSERKTKMIELSDAFLTLPGGVGTMDEMFEVLAFAHLGVSDKPVGVLNTLGFYDPLLRYIDHAVTEEFVPARVRSQVHVSTDPEQLLSLLLPS